MEELDLVLESVDGEESFMKEILNQTLTSASAKLKTIQEGFKKKNIDSVWKAFHAVKGTALALSLSAIGKVAEEGEKHFKNPQLDENESLKIIEKFENEIHRLEKTVKSFESISSS